MRLSEEQITALNRTSQDQAISSGIAPSLYLARAIEAEVAERIAEWFDGLSNQQMDADDCAGIIRAAYKEPTNG